MKPYDLDFIRSHFPVYQDETASQWAYMENAGGSQVPNQVTDKLIHFYKKTKVQPYSHYLPSDQAGEAMDRSYRYIAQAINADPEEISFGPSTSQNTYVLMQALAEELKSGDEVIVTNQDHEANIGVWWRLAKQGVIIKQWQVDSETGLLDVNEFNRLLNHKTRLVCFTHCSNIAATINPVKEITRHAHEVGAKVVVDGVSFAPHHLCDVKELDVDFYLFSLYKVYGPHLGVIYAKLACLEQLSNQGHFFNANYFNKRLTPAGPNHAEIACASGIIDYVKQVYSHHHSTGEVDIRTAVVEVFKLFAQHEQRLIEPLFDCLNNLPSVRIVGLTQADINRRAPTIAFYSTKFNSQSIAKALVDNKIGCGYGHFYAHRLIETLGVDIEDGVVRLSLVHYNCENEVKQVCRSLEALFS